MFAARVLRNAQNCTATAVQIRRKANCGRTGKGAYMDGAGALIRLAVTVRRIRERGA